jgi:hypothetical protein
MRLALLLLPAISAFAAGAPSGPVTETHTYNLAANGTIYLKNAAGDVTIEAWEQPRVEVTVIKWAPDPKLLEKISVTAEARPNALDIVSKYPKFSWIERPVRWTLNFDLQYRIKAPKTAKLVIDGYQGQVNVSGMSGDIHASNGDGDIFLLMPDGNYTIHARTKIGAINSDFPGKQRQNALLFGHDFVSNGKSGSKLDLNIGTGTVMVLKIRKPALTD